MNILYCGDRNILDGVLLSVLSLLEQVSEPLHVYLLTAKVQTEERLFEPLPERFALFLEQLAKDQDEENSVQLFDVTSLFEAQLPAANLDTRFTPCCMLRLYADLVEALPDKILYLDNDVLCRRDPAVFYNQDLNGHLLAGCPDHYGSWLFRRHLLHRDYLNSGVLLLDLNAIRADGLFARCRQLCQSKAMFMPDQSAINKLTNRKKICPRRYNEQRRLHDDTVFQHFTTSFRFFPYFHAVHVKPWNLRAMHEILHLHEYDELHTHYRTAIQQYIAKELPV